MKKIATLNKISPVGLGRFTDDYTIVEDVNEAEGIIVRSAAMHDMTFGKDLVAIARAGAGFNNIPIERCAEEGIVVFNTPGANANAVKELVLCAMIMCARNLPGALEWEKSLIGDPDALKDAEKGKAQFAGSEISGKTLGVIGLGAVGVLVANSAKRLGMDVIGYDPYITLHNAHELHSNIPVVSDLGELMPNCDYVTIHVPAMDSTKGMLDVRRIGQMKRNAVLLNFARDTLVDENAVIAALEAGELSAYVTDFGTEAVLGHEGVIALPHLGASTKEAEDNCAAMAAEQLMDFIENGNITNSVNAPNCSMGKKNPEAACRVVALHLNQPSMLQQISGAMGSINIIDLTNKSRGDIAYTMMDLNQVPGEEILAQLNSIGGMLRVRVL